jgi:hypothetical protein
MQDRLSAVLSLKNENEYHEKQNINKASGK